MDDDLSYEDYFKKVDELVGSLKSNWNSEQRVKALKIAIQLAKLLANTSQLKLYSRKYKIITDTLDEFGRLIYARIQAKANGEQLQQHHQQPPYDDYDDRQLHTSRTHTQADYYVGGNNNSFVSLVNNRELAKETCRNWFLKVASIRELVPRFYTELAILKTCDTLITPTSLGVLLTKEQFYAQSLRRLTRCAWGIGDPIVAIHARAYLCKLVGRLIGWSGEYCESNSLELITMNLEASATLITHLDEPALMRALYVQKIELAFLFDLICGALQSILNFVSLKYDDVYTDNNDQLSENARAKLNTMFACLMGALTRKGECPTVLARTIIMNSALRGLPADIIVEHSGEILCAIEATYKRWQETAKLRPPSYHHLENGAAGESTAAAAVVGSITSTLYSSMDSFALSLTGSDAFESSTEPAMRDSILSSVDSMLDGLLEHDLLVFGDRGAMEAHYLRCFKAWLSYANHYVDHNRIDGLLNKFIARIKAGDRKRQQQSHHYAILIELVKTLVSNKRTVEEFGEIFGLKSFAQLLDLLRKDDHKLDVSKWILETMRANLKLNHQHKSALVTDKQTIAFLLRLFAIMNDSLSLLIAKDDVEHLSQLVVYFLDKISAQDCKEKLEFYSRCRASLGNLNPVLEYLARRSLELATEFRAVERKRAARRNFLNGCLAFTFVTIPAINSSLGRLTLLIEGSQLALSQMSLSLADYYLKQALATMADLVGLSSRSVDSRTPTTTLNAAKLLPSQVSISKPLLDQADSLLKLMFDFGDHIDLKHKLALEALIKTSLFIEHPSLIEKIKRLDIAFDKDGGEDSEDNNILMTATPAAVTTNIV